MAKYEHYLSLFYQVHLHVSILKVNLKGTICTLSSRKQISIFFIVLTITK